MTAYSPEASIGWLDHDQTASDRVGEMLRAFEEPGILDTLGLGGIRDAFSELLHPGTSTIQTRLRYFLFLPWIFESLERAQVPPRDFARRLRDEEARLIDCLRPSGDGQGVIGFSAGRDLTRMPSSIYWNGLGRWGLRRYDISLAEYAKLAATLGQAEPERDNDGNAITATPAMWAAMPDPPENFLNEELTFDLLQEEAQLLVDHIREHNGDSLLAAASEMPHVAAYADFPWRLTDAVGSPVLREALAHGQCFSELTYGARLLYDLLVAREARDQFGWDTDAHEAEGLGLLSEWADIIESRHDQLRTWADGLDRLWGFLSGVVDVGAPTSCFVTEIVKAAVEDPRSYPDNAHLKARIREREVRLKGKRARLGSRSALEAWEPGAFAAPYDYRWRTVQTFMGDLAGALEQADAAAG